MLKSICKKQKLCYNYCCMKKIILLTLYTLISVGLVLLTFLLPGLDFILNLKYDLVWKIGLTLAIVISLIGLYLGLLKFKKIYKIFVTVFIIIIIVMAAYIGLYYSGLLIHFESAETLQAWFKTFGAWAWLVFFVIQYLQTVLIPVPAQITTAAGCIALGGGITFVISSIAVLLGSYTAFALGKWLGVKIAYKIAEKETVDKYRDLLNKKGRILLPIMFLFPLFPDDLLCFVAGTTSMSWLYFIIITVITRLIGIGCMCFTVELVPFSGWGIPVWIVLITLAVTVAIIMLKFQDQIENWIIKTFTKSKKDKSANNVSSLENQTETNNVEISNSNNTIAEGQQANENASGENENTETQSAENTQNAELPENN